MWFSYSERKIVEVFANSGDPDQTPHSAASDLGLHGLSVTPLGVSHYNGIMDFYDEGTGKMLFQMVCQY